MDASSNFVVMLLVTFLAFAVPLTLGYLLLLFLSTVLHPSSRSTLSRLINWVVYFDRLNTHLIYRPGRSVPSIGNQNKGEHQRSGTHLNGVTTRPFPPPLLDWIAVGQGDALPLERPFRGPGPDNTDHVLAILRGLETVGIQVPDDPTVLALAATHRVPAWILHSLVPDRILVFDREMISSARDYGRLLNGFARISRADWQPTALRAAIDDHAQRAFVQFLHQGQSYLWDFEHYLDWVSSEFDQLITEFADAHLPGTYIHLRTDSQESAYLYLPRHLARDFKGFLLHT